MYIPLDHTFTISKLPLIEPFPASNVHKSRAKRTGNVSNAWTLWPSEALLERQKHVEFPTDSYFP